jgi:serine protease Do
MVETRTKLAFGARRKPRLELLAGVALVATVILFNPCLATRPDIVTSAHAEAAQGPAGFADIVDKIKPAVISVRVKIDGGPLTLDDGNSPFSGESPLERFFRRFSSPDNAPDKTPTPRGRNLITGQGSGFFISADGYAVTNGHVVDKAKTVDVTTDDVKKYTAKVVGIDSRSDIALIKVDGSNFPFAHFAEGNPRIGDWVLAVGNPFGLGGTVTAGIVSARGRDIGAGPYDDFIQIDAAVNRGNSGGPTFNLAGNVIGVNTAIYSPSGGSVGIGFAIPAEVVRPIVAQLKEKGTVTRGYIGVQIQEVTPEIADGLSLKDARGALVAEPQADGPAAKAGALSGDVITAVNGKQIEDARELARTISAMAPGTAVTLSVIRNGQAKTLNMTLATLPDQVEANAGAEASRPTSPGSVPQLGFNVSPRSGGDGVVVSNVDPDGLAAERGIKNGDVILEASGKRVRTAADLRNSLDAAQKEGKRSVLLQLRSANATKFVAVPVGRG